MPGACFPARSGWCTSPTGERCSTTCSIPDEIRDYVRRLHAEGDGQTLVNVIVPETVKLTGPRHLLHNVHIQRLKSTLAAEDAS